LFQLTASHVGYANVCPSCSDGDVSRLVAKVAWSGKHCVEIEITSDRRAAAYFNSVQRRFGVGVTKSLVASREPIAGRESRKTGSGAEAGASYTTRLGEKRTVRR
jgi:hypothetical protein